MWSKGEARQESLEPVAQEHGEWQALALLVRPRRWFRSKHAGQLVQHPVARGIEPEAG